MASLSVVIALAELLAIDLMEVYLAPRIEDVCKDKRYQDAHPSHHT